MKIAILGVGGVGGYFGGRLAEQKHDVTFIARGANLAALQTNGLKIISPEGDATISNITATDSIPSIGQVDVVIVAVKGWQLPEVASQIKPMLAENTAVLPLLNGVDAPRLLAAALPEQHVLGGLCGIVAYIDEPGVIRHVGIKPFLRLGELNNNSTTRVATLCDALLGAGVICDIPDDIVLAMWKKFLFITPVSAVTSVSRGTIGVVRELAETRELVEQAMHEIVEVARSQGVGLTTNDVSKTLEQFDGSPGGGTTSLQRDIVAGKPSELDSQLGAVVRMANEAGIKVPVHETLYRCLLPQENLARS